MSECNRMRTCKYFDADVASLRHAERLRSAALSEPVQNDSLLRHENHMFLEPVNIILCEAFAFQLILMSLNIKRSDSLQINP